ncbi:MAG: peptidase A26, partial [Candidatus Pacearchaeota archaeon]
MKKRVTLILIFIFYIYSIFLFSSANPVLQWNSTLNAFMVRNCTELQNISLNLSGSYVLMNDIDCSDTINWNSGQGFEPVGNPSNNFVGSLDGQNYRIINLYIDRPSQDYVGLFGYVGVNGNIRNIGLINSRIRGNSLVGGIAGYTGYNVLITNSYNTG